MTPDGPPPADSMALPARLRALADHMEQGCKDSIAFMPAEELTTTMKMVEDFRSAAEALEAMEKVLEDIAHTEPTDGIGGLAQEALDTYAKTQPVPTGPSLDWIREAGQAAVEKPST